MRRLCCLLSLCFLMAGLRALSAAPAAAAAPAAPAGDESIEARLAAMVEKTGVTIVHLWAPWCSNCRNEMKPDGWAKFVAEHPDVQVVFVNIWHAGQNPAPKLAAGGLGGQPNFVALTHPNAARRTGERLERLFDLPITWVPTTWVFRSGRLSYALNYGEVRFDMLHQMVVDSQSPW